MGKILRESKCWIIFVLVLICTCTVSAAEQKKGETEIDMTVDTGPTVAEEQSQKIQFNKFGWAFVGISLGSFGAIALLKFSRQKRKDVGGDMEKADLMIKENKSVDWAIVTKREPSDPMHLDVQKVSLEYDEKVQTLESRKKELLAETSRVAVEIMRVWG